MAENVLKLKVDSQEYDAKLRRATSGLQALEQSLRQSGRSFEDVDKNTIQFVQELGRMGTSSQTARGRIGEMSSAFVELSQVEKRLTDQERQSPVGQALVQSLQQLRERTIEAKRELQELNDQLSNVKMPEMKGDGLFSGIGDKMSGALKVFAGNMLTKAAEEIHDIVTQSIELARAGEGIEIAFSRLNRPDLLDNLKEATHGTVSELELMKAAVKFNDFNLPVEELGTMLAFAQQKAKDTGQSVDYMVDSIVTGLGRKSLMILDNLGLSASEIKEKMKETGDMTSAVGAIIREQMSQAGGYIETAADRAARAAADQQNAMRNLGKALAPIAQTAASALSVVTNAVTQGIGIVVQYKDAILVAGSAIAAYTVVVQRAAIATTAHKVATTAATIAQEALNLAMKANPAGLLVAGITAVTTALIAFGSKSEEVARREKDAAEARRRQMERESANRERLAQSARDQANAISSAVGSVEARYRTLQSEWVKLRTESEKNAFINANANAFSELGRSINSAAEAEAFFVKNADKVIEALRAIAEADAIKGLLTAEYQKRAMFDPEKVRLDDYGLSTSEIRTLTPASTTLSGKSARDNKAIETEVQRYLQQWIESHPELKNAGLSPSDYRYQTTRMMGLVTPTFSMNASGIEKLFSQRKDNYIQQRTDELNNGVADMERRWEEALQKAKKAADDIPDFGSGRGSGTNPQKQGADRVNSALQAYGQAIEEARMEMQNGTITESEAKKRTYNAEKRLWEAYGDAYATTKDSRYQKAQEEVAARMQALAPEVDAAIQAQKESEKATRELARKESALAQATAEAIAAQETNDLKAFYQAQGKIAANGGTVSEATGFTATETNVATLIQHINEEITKADPGSALYNNLTSRLKDAQALQSVISQAVRHGVQLPEGFDVASLWKTVFTEDGNIPNETWRSILESINEKLKEGGFEPIKLTATLDYNDDENGEGSDGKKKGKTKRQQDQKTDERNSKGDEVKLAQQVSSIVGGVSGIMSGIESLGVELPQGMKDVVSGIQGVISILTSISTIVTAIQAISEATAIIPFANGGVVRAAGGFAGVVPGNYYSGDNIPALLNSGEVVLNRAQVSGLASALEGGSGQRTGTARTSVSGEQIWIALNNFTRASGRGELVTW